MHFVHISPHSAFPKKRQRLRTKITSPRNYYSARSEIFSRAPIIFNPDRNIAIPHTPMTEENVYTLSLEPQIMPNYS